MGLHRDNDVYVANIVKCRPPGNRVPESDEMRACTPFLIRQLDLVRPDVIVALGKTAVSFLLDSKDAMSRLRGRWHNYEGIPVLPTWHPAYLLRTPEAKADTWADMKLVLAKLGLPLPTRGA
jgi:DNA polymerase